MFRQLSELYISTLKEAKERSPPNFDDTPRGLLLALIKDRPTIWNSSARLTKDDVLASFQQCSAILSNMDPGYSIWAVIEKWCWVVESYVRCSVTAPPSEWRYNNTLDYLKQFATTSYPYLGCLSKKRRNELTKLYNDPEINVVMQKTEEIEFPVGIFRDEMLYLSGEDHLMQYDLELRTVGQVVNAKRRGRPSKVDKRSPVDNFYNLTPQSAQFQKLLESNMSSAFSIAFAESELIPDDLGFSPAMYMALIDMIQDKPELWQSNHPQKDNLQAQEQLFEDFGKQLIIKFRDTADISVLEKLTGPYVHLVWERLLEKFKEEDSLETVSKWKYYQPLLFLSTRLMPAFLPENFIKTEEPSSSAGLSARLAIASPSGSSQSEDSRMAASSPSTAFIGMPTTINGNKSIQTVLDNLIAARSKKEDHAASTTSVLQAPNYSELKQMLEKNNILKVDNENGPPLKRVKQEIESPPGSSRMIVYNDTRKTTNAPISTWVPPREDLTAKVKDETVQSVPQRKAQATAVIKSGFPLEKHLKKQAVPSMIPVTSSSIPQRNGILGLNSMILPPSAIQQALLKKMDVPTTTPSMSSTSSSQAQSSMNGVINGNNTEVEDKWTLLGRMIAMMAREIETRDPMSACELTRDLQQVIFQYNMKTLRPKENNSSSSSQ